MVEVVIVGAGKWALECWAALLGELAPLYRVRAVVDPRPGAAHAFAARLGLGPEAAFTDLDTALDHTPGLAAGIVLAPPDRHAHCSITLAQHGLHVLTEKPLATSRADLQALTTAVHKASVKLAVVQNYRYQARIQTARRILQAGELGELNYLVARFAADYRQPGSWDVGEAHTIPEPLLVEASIHHLDMIRYLTGQEVCAVAAMTRNPAWSSFAGPCVGGFLLRLESGALALYEANLVAAGEQHRWHGEYYRAECQHGALVCDGPTLTVLGHGRRRRTLHLLDADSRAGHRAIATSFAGWLAGGPPPSTHLDDNARSLAVLLAALDATRTGQVVPTGSSS